MGQWTIEKGFFHIKRSFFCSVNVKVDNFAELPLHITEITCGK